jgi:hypothetical protein
MKNFKTFLEQRDPELYDEMNRRDFLKSAAVVGIGSTLGGIGLKKLTDLGVGGKKIKPEPKSLNLGDKNSYSMTRIDYSKIGDNSNWKPDKNTEGWIWKYTSNNHTEIKAKEEVKKWVIKELIDRESDLKFSSDGKHTKTSRETRNPVRIGRILVQSEPSEKENSFIITVIHDKRPFSLGFNK